jgi:signal transduction histidine kinase/ligand-binding sensor domain-containing protein
MSNSNLLKIILICLCLGQTSKSLYGQPQNIEFRHYTINNGLSNGYINTIFQDSKGFLWIGTGNGLNRFDGISFKNYYFDSRDSTTIPGNNVNHMIEDTLGRIWVMTNVDFCVYNRATDNFTRKHLKIDGRDIAKLDVNHCFIDKKGFLWMGASTGIYRFNVYDNSIVLRNTIEGKKFLLEEDDVRNEFKNLFPSLVEDENGKVWAASYSNKMFCFNGEQNKFIAYAINHPDANKFSNRFKGFIKSDDGDFVLSIENNGLLIWNRKKNIFSLYKPDESDKGPHGNVLYGLAEDKNGLIWIGDRNSEGLSVFNKKTDKFFYCWSEELNPYSLNTNKINCICCDKAGSIWVGTIIGLDKYTPGNLKFNRYFSYSNLPGKLNCNNILCFAEDHAGNILIGTDGGGLNKFNPKTGNFVHYRHVPSDPGSISSDAIISICEDQEGTFWFGTFNGGLGSMKNGKFYSNLPDPEDPYSISNKNIWYILEDKKLNLWIATLTTGLDLFDRKTGRFYHYIHNDNDSLSICDNSLIELFEDSKHQLYITSYNGVSIIDLNSYDFMKMPPDIKFRNIVHHENMNSISSNAVSCVMEDKRGNIWFGTKASGLDKLDKVTGKFTNYSIKDGLPGNSVHSILVDDFNNLWLATDNGLAELNPETREINVFNMDDGLLNKSLSSWALKAKTGEMYFGGPYGFNSFYPDHIRRIQNQNIPDVVITGLNIFNKPVKIFEKINNRVILTADISETKTLNLTYKENYFSFEFIALDYALPEKNSYAYMMDDFDKGWINIGTKREANYTNLDPGVYTFRVKASNNDGIWNEKGSSIKIVIVPPWWKTLWFKIIAVAVSIIFFSSFFLLRVRQLKNQKVMLEQSVALKTSELKELNASKDKFFSIIAHDLKTPFNTIIGFSELMKEPEIQNDHPALNKYSTMINTSAIQTLRLLENLLEWANSQRGNLLFAPVQMNLSELVNDEFKMAADIATAKNIKLINNIIDNMKVVADKNMIRTILRNLITNAIKFTHKNGNVTVDSVSIQNMVEISVSDTGIGMSQHTMEKLFRIDANISIRGTENEKGTGLGLFLCKEFAEKHGGRIWAESEVGKGSVFKFVLPSS